MPLVDIQYADGYGHQHLECETHSQTPNFQKKPLRPITLVVGPSIAYITLTRGQFALIESCDVAVVGQCNWNASWNPKTQSFYAVRHIKIDGKNRSQGMHGFLLLPEAGSVADHTNGNTLDNRRRGNLRTATFSQNNSNSRMRSTNTSGYKGVSWSKGRRRWQAQISKGNKNFHLGYFPTAEAAHVAYCEASITFHGEFRRVA